MGARRETQDEAQLRPQAQGQLVADAHLPLEEAGRRVLGAAADGAPATDIDRHDDAHRSTGLRRRRGVAGGRSRLLRGGGSGERGGEDQGESAFHGRGA